MTKSMWTPDHDVFLPYSVPTKTFGSKQSYRKSFYGAVAVQFPFTGGLTLSQHDNAQSEVHKDMV